MQRSRDADKQMLSRASEWTMSRDMAQALGKQVQELSENLKIMNERMSRGLAPSKAIEDEYNAQFQKRQKQTEEAEMARRASVGPNGEAVMYFVFYFLVLAVSRV